ncbi:MAG: ethanolamine ammonia-lyase reactivating factor EutA [Elusimicrobiota bacterium]|jgi:ethanolamine utilization protein EutA|nr:ethanolamine ammonia-lyase reactivating factor EutA [Elusimicrobiota bacterium]
MNETLLSVGIDLGTTTTQVIFSRIEIENIASVVSVPRIKIVNKQVIYKGGIYFTPLIDRSTIDAVKVRSIVENEYRKASLLPKDIKVGAVIITGETARKENSRAVTNTLSGLAGDFVVATAGSDLESILAGRGSGASELSKTLFNKSIVNIDIGGGTTNIGVFKDGYPIDTSCLDIGGRQIIIDSKNLNVIYAAQKVITLSKSLGLSIAEGRTASVRDLEILCSKFADIIAQSLGQMPKTQDLDLFITAHPLKRTDLDLNGMVFSGGVADFIYNDYVSKDMFPYSDIGVLLGKAIRNNAHLSKIKRFEAKETIRATVVGAGSNSMDISGSTIAWSDLSLFPIQNIPIVKMTPEDEADNFKLFSARLAEKIEWFKDDKGQLQQLAVGFKGIHNPSFALIKELTNKIIDGMSSYLKTDNAVIIIVDNDMAKSLGYSLMNAFPSKKFIVIDSITVENGDYIDIGMPVSQGRVVPVVIKTLIFGK